MIMNLQHNFSIGKVIKQVWVSKLRLAIGDGFQEKGLRLIKNNFAMFAINVINNTNFDFIFVTSFRVQSTAISS